MARPAKIPAGERPQVLTAKELRTLLRVTPPTFARHAAAGDYERFELKPRIGHPRYSRRLVDEYLDGKPVYATPVFGATGKRQAS